MSLPAALFAAKQSPAYWDCFGKITLAMTLKLQFMGR